MLVLPFLAPFKAPPIASFHPRGDRGRVRPAGAERAARFASRLEMPRIASVAACASSGLIVAAARSG